jgi:hypothetical protein
MIELYLILHKVRGEPAFDIAQRLMIGEEEGWIIPTSGHRAYPCHWYELPALNAFTIGKALEEVGSADWDALPDHYTISRPEGVDRGRIRRLMDKLTRNKPALARRSF